MVSRRASPAICVLKGLIEARTLIISLLVSLIIWRAIFILKLEFDLSISPGLIASLFFILLDINGMVPALDRCPVFQDWQHRDRLIGLIKTSIDLITLFGIILLAIYLFDVIAEKFLVI